MGDSFTARKFAWLEAVARDANLRASASRLAIVLSGFINRETGDAWPSIGRLAAELGMSERGVQKAVEALVEREHLDCHVGGGRSSTNRYEMRLLDEKPRTPVQGIKDKPRTPVHPLQAETPNKRSEKPRTPVHPNLLREPIEDRESTDSLSEAFKEFWHHFPRKAGKKTAEKAFKKAVKDGTDSRDILAGTMRYAAERDGQEQRFTKHPSTWLNAGCWEDEPMPQNTTSRQLTRRMTASEFAQMRTLAMDGGHQT